MRIPKKSSSPGGSFSAASSEYKASGAGSSAPLLVDNRSSSTSQRKTIQSLDSGSAIQKVGDDPIETAVLDTNSESVKADVDAAMAKIKVKILNEAKDSEGIANALKGSGRDWMVYAPISSWWKGMEGLLASWDNSWSLEDTAGLLLDIGGALRKVTAKVDDGKGIMNDYMADSRDDSKKVNKDSNWNKDLPENANTQAGVSATTGNLLQLLRHFDVTTVREVEALMNGVILYWKNSKLKNALGQFHTAAEVWTAYTYHIEQYVNVAEKDADEGK